MSWKVDGEAAGRRLRVFCAGEDPTEALVMPLNLTQRAIASCEYQGWQNQCWGARALRLPEAARGDDRRRGRTPRIIAMPNH